MKIISKKDIKEISIEEDGTIFVNGSTQYLPIFIKNLDFINYHRKKIALEVLKELYPNINGLCVSYGKNKMDIICE